MVIGTGAELANGPERLDYVDLVRRTHRYQVHVGLAWRGTSLVEFLLTGITVGIAHTQKDGRKVTLDALFRMSLVMPALGKNWVTMGNRTYRRA